MEGFITWVNGFGEIINESCINTHWVLMYIKCIQKTKYIDTFSIIPVCIDNLHEYDYTMPATKFYAQALYNYIFLFSVSLSFERHETSNEVFR